MLCFTRNFLYLASSLIDQAPPPEAPSWPIYVKLGLFLAVAMLSVQPTLTFIRWRRMLEHDAGFQVGEAERARVRRIVMIEVHLAALIPLLAVIMSRGLGH